MSYYIGATGEYIWEELIENTTSNVIIANNINFDATPLTDAIQDIITDTLGTAVGELIQPITEVPSATGVGVVALTALGLLSYYKLNRTAVQDVDSMVYSADYASILTPGMFDDRVRIRYDNNYFSNAIYYEGDPAVKKGEILTSRINLLPTGTNDVDIYTSTGKVGIGITPVVNTKLHIYDATNSIIRLETDAGGQAGIEFQRGTRNDVYTDFKIVNDAGRLKFQSQDEVNLYSSSTSEVMRMTRALITNYKDFYNAGNMGIGIQQPTPELATSQLQIYNSSSCVLRLSTITTGKASIEFQRGEIDDATVDYRLINEGDLFKIQSQNATNLYTAAASELMKFSPTLTTNNKDFINVGKMYISSTETAVGAYKLMVDGDVSISGKYYIDNTPIVSSQWAASGTTIEYTTGTGVGIGTAALTYKLNVGGTLNANGLITSAGLTSSALITANAGITIPSGQTLTTNGNISANTMTASGLITANNGIIIPSNKYLSVGTSTTSDVDNNTNFAIPLATLYVKGGATAGGTCDVAIRGGLEGQNNGKARLWLLSDASHSSYIQNEHTGSGNTSLTFGTSSGQVLPTERMIINNIGNVGIGTNNPTTELHLYDDTTNTTALTIQNNKLISGSITSSPSATTTGTIGNYTTQVFTYTTDSVGLTGQTQYTITAPAGGVLCDILIVGGGGSGSETHGGGGGAGAVIFMTNVSMNGSYTIKVGKGGVCQNTGGFNGLGRKGIDSEIFKTTNNKIVAEGGGGGGQLSNANGGSGGSGGGGDAYNVAAGIGGTANAYTPILDGITGIKYGNNGGNAFGMPGNGGGGGGAGGVGENALAFNNVENERAHGGVGIKSVTINSVNYDFKTLFGTNTGAGVLEADGFLYFGGGGGNGRWLREPYGNEGGNGGLGGGGKGGWGGSGVQTVPLNGAGYPATGNTGGGGGGGGDYVALGGNGGSGIVIIRYLIPSTSSSVIELINGTTTDTNTDYTLGNYNSIFKVFAKVENLSNEVLTIDKTTLKLDVPYGITTNSTIVGSLRSNGILYADYGIIGTGNIQTTGNIYTQNGTITGGNLTISQNITVNGSITGGSISTTGSITGGGITGSSATINGDTVLTTNRLVVRGTAPTLYLRDTDNRSGMIHMNSSIMYFLNGVGNDTESWAPLGGAYALQLNMDNNNATFGGQITAYFVAVSQTDTDHVVVQLNYGSVGQGNNLTLKVGYGTFTGFHRCYTDDELYNNDTQENIDIFKNNYMGRVVIATGKIKTDFTRKIPNEPVGVVLRDSPTCEGVADEPVIEEVIEAVEPVAEPVEPVEPVAEPVEPVAEPVEPVAEPIAEPVEPVEPVAEPIAEPIGVADEPNNKIDEWYSAIDKDGISIEDAVPVIALSRKRKDKRVFGVLGSPTRNTNNKDRLIVNSVGEGGICVANTNGNIENGDYLQTSDLLGYGEKQDDDLLHNYTIGKATIDCDFQLDSPYYQCHEIENGIRVAFIACSYHCG